jgi:predicted transcriptional regulator
MAQRSFKLPDDLDARLVAYAKADERPVSYVIVKALEQALDADRPRASVDSGVTEVRVEAGSTGGSVPDLPETPLPKIAVRGRQW